MKYFTFLFLNNLEYSHCPESRQAVKVLEGRLAEHLKHRIFAIPALEIFRGIKA